MRLAARIRAYAAHPDGTAAACNRIALLVASSQPTYPLYLWWLVGGAWRAACWTFLSTPFFLAVPALARRRPEAGPVLLVAAGVGNTMLSAKALGSASGVELFLVPIALIALLASRGSVRGIVLIGIAAVATMHSRYGAAWAPFSPAQDARLLRINAWSAAMLSLIIAWTLRPRATATR